MVCRAEQKLPHLQSVRSYLRQRMFMSSCLVLALTIATPMVPAHAQQVQAAQLTALPNAVRRNREIRSFYAARANRPLRFSERGLRPEAAQLLQILNSSRTDGLVPGDIRPVHRPQPCARLKAAHKWQSLEWRSCFSSAFATYVRDVRNPQRNDLLRSTTSLFQQSGSTKRRRSHLSLLTISVSSSSTRSRISTYPNSALPSCGANGLLMESFSQCTPRRSGPATSAA